MNFPRSSISFGYGQWFDKPEGYRKLVSEYDELDMLPFDTYLNQDRTNRDISHIMIIPYNGYNHQVKMTYDREHPSYKIRARILSPILDEKKMGGHVYPGGDICYVLSWDRSMRAIHVAFQIAMWIKDYHDGKLGSRSHPPVFASGGDAISRLKEEIGRYWRTR